MGGQLVSAPVVVCAPDKLRGALDATEAAHALATGVIDAGAQPVTHPLADGGEGTLDVLVALGMAVEVPVVIADALGAPVAARLGDLGAGTWLAEAAEAVALARLPSERRDPRRATSFGVGELVAAAITAGARRVQVALGGSATLDGGVGMLEALAGERPRPTGDDEMTLARSFDLAAARRAVAGVELDVLFDVDVPLTGPHGAARLFGPQKGATAGDVPVLEAGLERLAARLGAHVVRRPGAGAAGGLGAALYALGASGHSGAARVLELTGFDDRLAGAGLCLTGEGSVDASTLRGKTVDAVVGACRRAGVPCAVLGGRVEPSAARDLRHAGAAEVAALGPADRPLTVALARCADDLRREARRLSARYAATSPANARSSRT